MKMEIRRFFSRLNTKLTDTGYVLYRVNQDNGRTWQGYGQWIGVGAQHIVYDDAMRAHYLMAHECHQLSDQKFFLFEGVFIAM